MFKITFFLIQIAHQVSSKALTRKFEQNFYTETEEKQCPLIKEFENLNISISFKPTFTGMYKTQLKEEYNQYLKNLPLGCARYLK